MADNKTSIKNDKPYNSETLDEIRTLDGTIRARLLYARG